MDLATSDFGSLDGDERILPTVTLEGWRALVDRPPAEFKLLPEEELAQLSESERAVNKNGRLNYHSELAVFETSQLTAVVRHGRILILINRRERSGRRAMVVSGPAGTGKSTNLKSLGCVHELSVRAEHPRGDRIPVVYVMAPDKGHSRMFAMEFARFLGLTPIRRSHTTTDIADQVCKILIAAHCDLVLVDEVHRMDNGTSTGDGMTESLKYFIERLPATFVFAGINVENAGFFSGVLGAQLAARSIMLNTSPLPYGEEWRALVSSMELSLRLYRHEDGALLRMSRFLHTRTGGRIASLSALIRSAAMFAIVEGSEAIDRPLLKQVPPDILVDREQ